MTNLQWIIKQNLNTLIIDALIAAKDAWYNANLPFGDEWTIDQIDKLNAYIWLFSERKEKTDVQLSENNE